jgi:predicted  nucleic acid-binding Zn-ribbon protein
LNDEANEDSIVAAITTISNKKAEAEDKLKKMEDDYAEAKKAKAEMEDKLKAMEDKLEDAKKKAEESDKAKAEAEEDAKKDKAKNLIEGFVKTGKIKLEAKAKWEAMAIVNFDDTKTLLEELPTNGKAAIINVGQSDVTEGNLTMVAAKKMLEVRNSLQLN